MRKCLWKADRKKAESRILILEKSMMNLWTRLSVCMKLSVSVHTCERLREPHETRSAKNTKCSGAEERTMDTSREMQSRARGTKHEACNKKIAARHARNAQSSSL